MHYTELDLTKIIMEYFETESYPHALLLKGEWGTGKTYFVHKFISQNEGIVNGKKIIYISLYGIASLQELKEHIYNEILNAKLGVGNRSVLVTGASFALGVALSSAGLKIEKKDADKVKGILKDIAVKPQNYLFIFDDLERTKIPTEEWMGVISNLLERYKTKVLLIANEDVLQKDVLKNIAYRTGKEKIIGRTIAYAPTLAEKIDSLLQNDLYKKLKQYRDNIVKIMINSQCNNLRYFEFAGNIFNLIDRKLDKNLKNCLHDYESKIEPCLVECIMRMSIAYQSGKDRLDERSWNGKVVAYQTYYKGKVENLVDNDFFLAFKFVEDFIYDSFVSTAAINATLRWYDGYLQDQKRHENPLNTLIKWYEMDEKDVIEQLELVKKAFFEGIYSLQDYHHLFYIFYNLQNIGFNNINLQELQEQAIKNISCGHYGNSPVILNPLFEAQKVEKIFPEVWKAIKKEKDRKSQEKISVEIDNLLDRQANIEEVTKWMRDKFTKQPLGIFCYINLEKMFNYILKLHNSQIVSLCGTIGYFVNDQESGTLKQYLPRDSANILKLQNLLQKTQFSEKVKAYNIRMLCDLLQSLYKKLNES